MPDILGQDYPNFQVVVINDGSFDGSKKMLEDWEVKEPKLKVVHVIVDERYHRGKKFALTMGIKAAAHDLLLFTDADCVPSSKNWIRTMAQAKGENQIVIGHGPFQKKKSLLNTIQEFESFQTAQQYFSYALANQTYMAVGRNLMYEKALFFENKGFASHQHILSGDDDLFIQEVAQNNVSICVDSESWMYSQAKATWKSWFKQKRRHQSTSKLYKPKFKFLLALIGLSKMAFWIALIFCILNFNLIGLLVAIGTIIISWAIAIPFAQRLNMNRTAILYPFLELLFFPYLLLFSLLSFSSKPITWN